MALLQFRISSLLVAAAVLAGISGCGPGKASVGGKVTYKGKPLAMGTVFMSGSDGVAVTAAINADGTYRIDSMVPGLTKVGVSSPKPVSPQIVAQARKGRPPAPNAPPPQDAANWFEVPEKYVDPRTSELTVTLKPGDNVHNIELQ
jgi:hypothetical protein